MDKKTATFGTGCFWCTEAIFKQLKGVEKVTSGYSGGAEVVQITFNPQVISFKDLLNVFWSVHDPTTLNRQGSDIGTQYRSVIFYHDNEQKKLAERSKLEAQKLWQDPIVTQIAPFTNFYPAENYHQDYFEKNPQVSYCQLVINPKLAHFREKFKDKLKA